MAITKDMAGQRFGKLVVVSQAESKNGAQWHCICDCGNSTIVHGGALRQPAGTKSCGCVQKNILCRINLKRKMDHKKGRTARLGYHPDDLSDWAEQ